MEQTPRSRPSLVSPGALALLIVVALVGGLLGGAVLPPLLERQGVELFGPSGQPSAPQTTQPAAPQGPSAPGQGPTRNPPATAAPPSTDLERTIVGVVERVQPSVVSISVRALAQSIFGVVPQEGAGSGVIVRSDGYVLTNYHVVENAQDIRVKLLNGRTLTGRVVGSDQFQDLAVVKVDSQQPLPAAPLGNSSTLRVGQLAIALGNPFGLSNTVTVGVVSALNRNIQLSPTFIVENLIQTDAAINPGNSGGALVDSSGRLIGINTAIIQQAQGIGFAIPIDIARAAMDQIIAQGRLVRPYLGVAWGADVDETLQQAYGLPVDHGFVVAQVEQGSPAARAGIQANDIVAGIDGREVRNWNDFIRALIAHRPGDTVRIELYRGGRRMTVTATLDQRAR